MASNWGDYGIDQRIASYQERYASSRTDQRVFIAHVEMDDDPRNIGRVKVRVPGIHSPDPAETPTNVLPWATPGGPLSGQLVSPEVGDVVLVVPLAGSWDHLFIISTLYGNRKEERIRGRQPFRANPLSINTEPRFGDRGVATLPEAQNDYTYNDPKGNSAPVETFELRETTMPTVRSWLRTPRGHALYTDDQITRERMRMLDRAGAGVEMKAPVTITANRGNAYRRGSGSAYNGDPIPMRDTDENGNAITVAAGTWRAMFADAIQQFFGMFAYVTGDAEVRIQGKGSGEPTKNWEFSQPQNDGTHFISLGTSDTASKNRILLHSVQGSIIQLTDKIELRADLGSWIIMDGDITGEGTTVTWNPSGADGIVRKKDLEKFSVSVAAGFAQCEPGDGAPFTPVVMSSESVFAGD